MFGKAHVDTPKGDLDMSGDLSTTTVVENSIVYPYGTPEQYPLVEDSDLNELTNTAHYYMECSNAGLCDRSTGECACYNGFDGVACQRASCPGYPNVCSGLGVCKTKHQLALEDNGNQYLLWDNEATMGCVCDAGQTGPDCSLKLCKYGVDPLYLDDSAVAKYAVFDFATLTTDVTAKFTDGTPSEGLGKWSIRFYDNFDHEWITSPIVAGAPCDDVIAALESLPNSVIAPGYTSCIRTARANTSEVSWVGTDAAGTNLLLGNGSPLPYTIRYQMSIWQADLAAMGSYFISNYTGDLSPANVFTAESSYVSSNTSTEPAVPLSGFIYRIKFRNNPGALSEPKIDLALDGTSPTLWASKGNQLITKVWTDGQQGEDNDYFANHCDKVTFTIQYDGTSVYYLNGLTSTERSLLKTCLGDSNGNTADNVEVENWDYGNYQYPHFVKLVHSQSSYDDSTYYCALIFDNTLTLDNSGESGTFILLNPFTPPDGQDTDPYEIYTTQGVLGLTSDSSQIAVSFASKYFFTTNPLYDNSTTESYNGDISCYSKPTLSVVPNCLNKGDLFTFLSVSLNLGESYANDNPPHLNIYTTAALLSETSSYLARTVFHTSIKTNADLSLGTRILKSDLSSNWAVSLYNKAMTQQHPYRIYKFTPNAASTYNYVNQCSNRGICGTDTGLCNCFAGYTSDDCSVQSALAL